jgi:CRISPR/Cas system-associated protein Csx1
MTIQLSDETNAVEKKALAIPDQAKLIVVSDKDSMAMADNTVEAIGALIKEVDGTFKPLADKAFQAHRSITAKWKEVKQPLEDAKTYLVNQVKAYQRKVREEAEAEQRRLAEIARKQEEERRLAEALQAEAEGNTEEAQAIIEEEMFVPTPIVKPDVQKVDNRKYRTIPRARVTNKMALIRFIAANPALADLLDVNQSVINNKAKAMGKEINNIPGLSYYEE